MKYILISLTWFFSIIVVPYLLIGFIAWEFNINELFSNMREISRGFIVFLWILYFLATIPIFTMMLFGDY